MLPLQTPYGIFHRCLSIKPPQIDDGVDPDSLFGLAEKLMKKVAENTPIDPVINKKSRSTTTKPGPKLSATEKREEQRRM